MGKNKDKSIDLKLLKGGRSYYMTIVGCLVVFLGALVMLISSFNGLIKRHDEKLSGEIGTLVSEKMSNSLFFMTNSALDVSSILEAQHFEDPKEVYEQLKDYRDGKIQSIGFIDENNNIYASETEVLEFEKWNLLETAELANPVSISAPYRSTKLGQPVITLFTDFEYGDSKHGYIFLTYLFSTLQEVATTESLSNEIEIWLMDAKSANIIQCVGRDSHASGGWANAYLAMHDINPDNKPDYDNWYRKMLKGKTSASVGYWIGKTYYTQFCSSIDSMPGWYVVVRIPSNALSATMGKFRNYVLLFLVDFIAVVFILIFRMNLSWKRENQLLSQLSINDPLTGVLNRRAFELTAENMLAQSKEVALIFFDIDFFKQVNDNFGHDTGDKLLKEFSELLKKNFSEYSLISRYGGDEFVVMIHLSSVENVTAKLNQAMADVHALELTDNSSTDENDQKFTISFSAGAARYPHDAATLSELQKCADTALYIVKERGRNSFLWYKEDMQQP